LKISKQGANLLTENYDLKVSWKNKYTLLNEIKNYLNNSTPRKSFIINVRNLICKVIITKIENKSIKLGVLSIIL